MASPQDVRIWPTLDEYDEALKEPLITVYDADVKEGKLSTDCRPLRLNGKSNKYVTVYKMSDLVIRCFFTNIISNTYVSPPSDIHERYLQINNYVRANIGRLSFLVPQIWVERGININGHDWPFIKSAFIRVEKLGDFLEDNLKNRHLVAALAKQWLDIINTLESLQIAHGDLDVTNVLVYGTPPNVTLRLVDFDCMYVPALKGAKLNEYGHEHFQPIQPGVRQFNVEMDRFSSLIIYLSLLALTDNPELWRLCRANESNKLLFGAEDFRDLSNSNAYTLLRRQGNQDIQKCLNELVWSLREKRMPISLSDILRSKAGGMPPMPTPAHGPSSSAPFTSSPIPIPVDFIVRSTPPSPPQTPPQKMPDVTIPIPIDFLQPPSNTSSSQTYAPSGGQQQSSSSGQQQQQQLRPPSPAARKGVHPAVWWLLAFAVLTVMLALANSAGWLILTLLLVIAILIVAQQSRK